MRFLLKFVLVIITLGHPAPLFAQDDTTILRLQGSNTIGDRLAPRLVKGFLEHKGYLQVVIHKTPSANEKLVLGLDPNSEKRIQVTIAAHGSSTGFQALKLNRTDIAMSSRPIKESEANQLEHMGDMRGFSNEHVLAIDGVSVIVHPSNKIKQLTIEQVAKIFRGEIRSWSEVGGPELPITVYSRDNKSGTWDTFKSLVLNGAKDIAHSTKRFESNDELSAQVAQDVSGIGFVGLASVGRSKAVAIGHTGIEPLAPSNITVATEDYALSRRLFLYSPHTTVNNLVGEFLQYAHSDSAQQIVDSTGFVSQVPIALKPSQVSGPDAYKRLVSHAERLSVNIRFREGSASLDNKARQDVERLVALAERPEFVGRELLLIGFGDEKQSASRSEILSKLRAVKVKSALHAKGIAVAPVAGFGSYNPVASNHGDNRLRNQRVEVWVL